MDSEKLKAIAVGSVQENVQRFEEKKRKEAERAEAVAKLTVAMEAREEAYKGLASIAVHHSVTEGVSTAVPVGRVTVRANSGEDVERTIHAVVSNNYGKDMRKNPITAKQLNDADKVAPEEVYVAFFIEAEAGDVESGLLSANRAIGQSVTNGETTLLYGQEISRERYRHLSADVPEDLKSSVGTCGPINLYVADSLDTKSANAQHLVVSTQIPTMIETLSLLQTGIQQTQAVV